MKRQTYITFSEVLRKADTLPREDFSTTLVLEIAAIECIVRDREPRVISTNELVQVEGGFEVTYVVPENIGETMIKTMEVTLHDLEMEESQMTYKPNFSHLGMTSAALHRVVQRRDPQCQKIGRLDYNEENKSVIVHYTVPEDTSKPLQRFWVSWWSQEEPDTPFQYWVSGYKADKNGDYTISSLCAVIDAPDEDTVWKAMATLFPDYEQRLFQPTEPNFVPGDRFPNFMNRTRLE